MIRQRTSKNEVIKYVVVDKSPGKSSTDGSGSPGTGTTAPTTTGLTDRRQDVLNKDVGQKGQLFLLGDEKTSQGQPEHKCMERKLPRPDYNYIRYQFSSHGKDYHRLSNSTHGGGPTAPSGGLFAATDKHAGGLGQWSAPRGPTTGPVSNNNFTGADSHPNTACSTPPASIPSSTNGASPLQDSCGATSWMTPRVGRKKRCSYTKYQILELEKNFLFNMCPSRERRQEISRHVNLSDRQVKIWFQNRRMKMKRMNKAREEQLRNQQERGHQAVARPQGEHGPEAVASADLSPPLASSSIREQSDIN